MGIEYSALLGIGFFLVIAVGGFLARQSEKKQWNNGICAKSGRPWRRFDTSSQGCRGYTDGDNYCWITYSVDVIKPSKQK